MTGWLGWHALEIGTLTALVAGAAQWPLLWFAVAVVAGGWGWQEYRVAQRRMRVVPASALPAVDEARRLAQ